MIRSGRMRHRLRIEQVTETQNALGEPIETWTEYVTLWGELSPLTGREHFLAAQLNAEITARAMIRYYAGITPKMRLVSESIVYDIVAAIDKDTRHESIELLLSQGLRDSG